MVAFLGWGIFWILLAGSIPLQIVGLPGAWLVFADVLALRFLGGSDTIGTSLVLILAIMAAGGELIEFYTSMRGAGEGTPVRGSGVAALVGGIFGGAAGFPLFFGLGAIPGMAAGAFIAVFVLSIAAEGNLEDAYYTAQGAFFGRLKGSLAKLVIVAVMITIVIYSLAGG